MATISQMIEDVIRREGGYVNHPADRGGPTKYGITQRTLDQWLGRHGKVRAVTKADARVIYRSLYYIDPRIDQLPGSIQPLVFDAAVHHGPSHAVKMLQTACDTADYDPGPIDGIVGARTIAAARLYERSMLDHYLFVRAAFMRSIVENDPTQAVFLDGWLNRLKEFA